MALCVETILIFIRFSCSLDAANEQFILDSSEKEKEWVKKKRRRRNTIDNFISYSLLTASFLSSTNTKVYLHKIHNNRSCCSHSVCVCVRRFAKRFFEYNKILLCERVVKYECHPFKCAIYILFILLFCKSSFLSSYGSGPCSV